MLSLEVALITLATFLSDHYFLAGCYYLQCFGAVGLTAGRASGLQKMEWWGTGMVVCLERGTNDLHMVQLMSLLPHHHLLQ